MPNRVYMREVDMGTDRPFLPKRAMDFRYSRAAWWTYMTTVPKATARGAGRAAQWTDLPFGDPTKAILPQWRIAPERTPDKLVGRINRYRIGFCDV